MCDESLGDTDGWDGCGRRYDLLKTESMNDAAREREGLCPSVRPSAFIILFSRYTRHAPSSSRAPRLWHLPWNIHSIVINMIEMSRPCCVAEFCDSGEMMITFIHNGARPTQQSHAQKKRKTKYAVNVEK